MTKKPYEAPAIVDTKELRPTTQAYRWNAVAIKAAAWATVACGREIEACDVGLRADLGGPAILWTATVGDFSVTGEDPAATLRALYHAAKRAVDLRKLVRRALNQAPFAKQREILANLLDGCEDPEVPDVATLDDLDVSDMLYDLTLDEADPLETWLRCRMIAGEM